MRANFGGHYYYEEGNPFLIAQILLCQPGWPKFLIHQRPAN